MSKVWVWVKSKLWPFLKAHWKAISLVLVGISAAWAGKRAIGLVVSMVQGAVVKQVASPVPFAVLDAQHVGIKQPDGSWQAVDVTTLGVDDARKVVSVGKSDEKGTVPVAVDNPPL